jgi:hypothetical protein
LAHTVTLGGRFEATDIYNFFLSGANSAQFRTIDLAPEQPEQLRVLVCQW